MSTIRTCPYLAVVALALVLVLLTMCTGPDAQQEAQDTAADLQDAVTLASMGGVQ